MNETVEESFARIDPIVSVNTMLVETQKLSTDIQKEVILTALRKSRHQFTWSWIAKTCGIPASDWPEKETVS